MERSNPFGSTLKKKKNNCENNLPRYLWPFLGVTIYWKSLLPSSSQGKHGDEIIIGVLTQICLKVCPLCAWTRPLVIFFRFHMYRLNGHSWLFTTQHQWDKSYYSRKIQVEVSEITTSPLSRGLIKSDVVSQGNDTSWCCTQRFKGYMYLIFKSGTENFGWVMPGNRIPQITASSS